MQEFISILKYILQSNVINFILMLIVLAWCVKKLNLNKSFDESVLAVENGIKKSDSEKNNAKKNLDKAKSLIDKLPEDITKLKKSAQEKGEIFKSEIEDNAQKSILGLEKNINRTIEVEEKKISNVMTDKTIAASIELSGIQIQKLLKENPDLHNKFIMDSLDELDKVNL